MARPSDIANDELRGMVETAFAAMRAGKGAEAVHACADAYLRHVALHPEVLKQTIPMRGREISRLLRWPALVLGIVVSLAYWVFGQSLGGPFWSESATDVNAAPLLVLLAIALVPVAQIASSAHPAPAEEIPAVRVPDVA